MFLELADTSPSVILKCSLIYIANKLGSSLNKPSHCLVDKLTLKLTKVTVPVAYLLHYIDVKNKQIMTDNNKVIKFLRRFQQTGLNSLNPTTKYDCYLDMSAACRVVKSAVIVIDTNGLGFKPTCAILLCS